MGEVADEPTSMPAHKMAGESAGTAGTDHTYRRTELTKDGSRATLDQTGCSNKR